MKRSFIAVAGILLVLFITITYLKSPSSVDSPENSEAQVSDEREKTLLFWTHYRKATDHRLNGQLDSAEVNYQRALQLNDHHEDALYYLGNILLVQGKYEKAEAAWLELSRIDPSSARAYSQLGTLYFCIDDTSYFNLPAARQAFERALSINKEETGPLLRLGQIALLDGDDSTASYYFDAVRVSNHKSREAYFYAGYLFWKNGNLNNATDLFRQAVAISKSENQNDGVIGEGDTKDGISLVSEHASCPFIHNQIADLDTYNESVNSDLISQKYHNFDTFLGSR